MRKFKITAKNRLGKTVELEVDATNKGQAQLNCESAGLQILEIDDGKLSPFAEDLYLGLTVLGGIVLAVLVILKNRKGQKNISTIPQREGAESKAASSPPQTHV